MNVKNIEKNGNQATITVEIDKDLMEKGVNAAYMKTAWRKSSPRFTRKPLSSRTSRPWAVPA